MPNDINAGRSRRHKLVVIDEAAFTKNDIMQETWERSIEPTLYDYGGSCIVVEQWCWKICNESKHGFKQFHATKS
jgi:hypothetical protein